jgi:phosphocarrier protein
VTEIRKELHVINKLGLHARAAAQLVRLTNGFDCEVNLVLNGQAIDGKSIMGIMMLAAAHGSRVELQARGNDAESAVTAIAELFANRFGESE